MRKGNIDTGQLRIFVGEHSHQLETSELSIDLKKEFETITVSIVGRTFSSIPVELKIHLGKVESFKLLKLLKNRCEKL